MRIPQQVIGLNVKDIMYDDFEDNLNEVYEGYLWTLCWVLMHEFVGWRYMSCFREGDFCLAIGLDLVVIGVMDAKYSFDLTFIGSYLEA